MSLRDVMAFIQKQYGAGAAVTPVTPVFCDGVTPEPAWIGRVPPVTPVTPVFGEVGADAQKGQPGEASNDASASDPAPAPAPAPAPEPVDWRALDKAYQAHHAHCHVCKAAGRGARYSLRCGVGAALWTVYDDAANTPGALPWQRKKGQL